jgi:hypothetical protein
MYITVCRHQDPGKHFHRSGLARAVGAYVSDSLSSVNGQVDVIDCHMLRKPTFHEIPE